MSTIYKWNGSTTSYSTNIPSFYQFLIDAKNNGNIFLSDLQISKSTLGGGEALLTIADSFSNQFWVRRANSTSSASGDQFGAYSCTNGSITRTITRSYSSTAAYNHEMWVKYAILCDNGIMISFGTANSNDNVFPSSSNAGYTILCKDSNNKLSFITNNVSIPNNTNNASSGTNLYIIVGDSTSILTVNITPTYNLPKTGIFPIATGATLNTTLPSFYTSLQSELSGLGPRHGRMDGTDYISNGYCFLRTD